MLKKLIKKDLDGTVNLCQRANLTGQNTEDKAGNYGKKNYQEENHKKYVCF